MTYKQSTSFWKEFDTLHNLNKNFIPRFTIANFESDNFFQIIYSNFKNTKVINCYFGASLYLWGWLTQCFLLFQTLLSFVSINVELIVYSLSSQNGLWWKRPIKNLLLLLNQSLIFISLTPAISFIFFLISSRHTST